MEVAPTPILLLQKPSDHCPKLQTIKEDRAEGRDDETNSDHS